jgi:hypothetical protein
LRERRDCATCASAPEREGFFSRLLGLHRRPGQAIVIPGILDSGESDMRGTGLLNWGNETVYAYYTTDGNTLRVRISVDDADRLGLTEGARVWVRLPGRDSADVLVLRLARVPPFVWIELSVMTPTAIRAG